MNKIRNMGPSKWILMVTLSVLWGGFFSAKSLFLNSPLLPRFLLVSASRLWLSIVDEE